MFSLRLLAENNPTAPEVIGRASEYLGPMGFSVLIHNRFCGNHRILGKVSGS